MYATKSMSRAMSRFRLFIFHTCIITYTHSYTYDYVYMSNNVHAYVERIIFITHRLNNEPSYTYVFHSVHVASHSFQS
jgi:hypothetical protein